MTENSRILPRASFLEVGFRFRNFSGFHPFE